MTGTHARKPTAADVARSLLETLDVTAIGQLKLQKLLFYCQAAALVWLGETLFDEDIEAWANGPVVPSIWRENRYRSWIEMANLSGDPSMLDARQKACVEAIASAYGSMSGGALSNQTHLEDPWIEARKDLPNGASGVSVISVDTMRDFYRRKWLPVATTTP